MTLLKIKIGWDFNWKPLYLQTWDIYNQPIMEVTNQFAFVRQMLVIWTIFSVQTNAKMLNERHQNMLKYIINNCFNNGLEGSIDLAN